ncbi:quinone oxidoreductase-like [Amphiura filiformis]|uniref:quinone oxidoreductase-like n=1 Tax=Amphiura filiformis TaxID=82378 RepID=UPI003B224002
MTDVEQLTAQLESQQAENDTDRRNENGENTRGMVVEIGENTAGHNEVQYSERRNESEQNTSGMIAIELHENTGVGAHNGGQAEDDGGTVTITLLPQDNEADNSTSTMPGGDASMLSSQTSELRTPGGDASMMNTSINSQTSEQGTPKKKTPGKWSKYKKRYNEKWEKEPGLMEWVRRVPGDDTKVLCRFCTSTHRAHRTELRRHADSVKHKSQSAFVVLPYDPNSTDDTSPTYSHHVVPRMFKCMRVVRVTEWGGSDVLEVFSDVSMPEPENDQVLIKVGAVGVNPVDAYIRSGHYANLPNLPWTPGADCSGTVESCGHLVTNFRPGDRVYSNASLTGTYAEYTLCSEDSVFALPDQLDFKGGAGIGIPYFTAYRALMQRARARAGQTVLVHGASGSVGMATVQFARAYGMTVLGTAGTEDGMRLVREFGAHFVFNHRCEDYCDEILTATEGDGVDVIIEMLANVNLQRDLELLSMGGIIAVVGNRGTIEINPRLLMPKESSIVGVMLQKSTKKERREIATSIRAGIEAGWIRPHIGMEFPLEGAAFAHEELMTVNGKQGRIVLVP